MIAQNTRYFRDSMDDERFPMARATLNSISKRSMAVGAALLIVGLIAIAHAFTATVVSIYFLGILLLVGAASWGTRAFSEKRWTSAIGDAFACVLYVIAAAVAFRNPIFAATGFTLVIASLFMVGGIVRIIGAAAMAPPQWGWVLANGIITLALGLMVFAQWPISSLWLIGTLIGVDMAVGGATALMAGLEIYRNTRAQEKSSVRNVA